MNSELVYQVSDFVAVFNQTIEYAYPSVDIVGELANFRISKNRWVYFDLKDELSNIKFFGTIYVLPGPLEDGMMVQVKGVPRLHPNYGFSITAQTIQPVGEGSIKRASTLLEAKLDVEGLFEPTRKRRLPFPPHKIGLITSSESAAYADFMKILNQRWVGIEIELIDVQVQGESAVPQIVAALTQLNALASPPEVLVITRGGGSAGDLAAFNTEQVTRAVAASRIPTLVAIGHEVDVSLAERVADMRASTPSNAAELLVPDKRDEKIRISSVGTQLHAAIRNVYSQRRVALETWKTLSSQALRYHIAQTQQQLESRQSLLAALGPQQVLRRGYAILRDNGRVVRSVKKVPNQRILEAQLYDGTIRLRVDGTEVQ